MRRIAVTIVAAALGLLAAGCSTAEDLTSRAQDVRSSAAAVANAIPGRQVCLQTRDDLRTLDSLAGRVAANPSLARRLAPQVNAVFNQLSATVGDRAEWQAVLTAVRNLGSAMTDADGATVKLAARQVQLAVKVAQAGCSYAH